MKETIDRRIRVLSDKREGWVHRRDAALELGAAAAAALGALQRHAADEDVDVRQAVREAMEKIRLPELPEAMNAYSLDTLAKSCARKDRRSVSAVEGGYEVTVSLRENRKQVVRLSMAELQGGVAVVQLSTRCGSAGGKLRDWALRNNASLCHAAFALDEADGEPCIVMLRNIPHVEANPSNVKSAVKEMARYGDWVENTLDGKDVE